MNIEQLAAQLMAALIMEDRIAWTKDKGGGQDWRVLARSAIAGAKTLRQLLDEEMDRDFPPVGQNDWKCPVCGKGIEDCSFVNADEEMSQESAWPDDSLATFN